MIGLRFARKKSTILAVFALVLAGVVCIWLRVNFIRPASPLDSKNHWRIYYTIKFRAQGAASHGWIALPKGSPSIQIKEETFSHSQLEVSFNRNSGLADRVVLFFVPPQVRKIRFEAQLDIVINEGIEGAASTEERLSAEVAEQFLIGDDNLQVSPLLLQEILPWNHDQERDPEMALESIFVFCRDNDRPETILDTRQSGAETPAATSLTKHGRVTTLGRVDAMIALCRAAGIPARLVSGFVFIDTPVKQPHTWVEAAYDERWRIYDPVIGAYEAEKTKYLPLCRDGGSIFKIFGAKEQHIHFSVKRKPPPSKMPESRYNEVLNFLDLTNMPPGLSDAVALILLLPLGGLLISIYSNIFGLKSFGYFIPALIGISFVGVKLIAGISVFITIMIIGLGGRYILDNLKLNKMPRLTLVLLLVVLSLSLTVSILDIFDLRPNSRSLLLPMISLTMMTELFHTRVEKSGYIVGFKKLGITLMVAFCCWLIFRIDKVQWIFLTYPESEFFVAASLVLVGSFKAVQQTSEASLS
jgi:hypothetical protein